MKPDPKLRKDGRCAQCGNPRKLSKQARQYAGHQVDLDPFCSTKCARAWHGCPLPKAGVSGWDDDEMAERMREKQRDAAAMGTGWRRPGGYPRLENHQTAA